MKKYIRCHLVEAMPMTRGAYNKKRGWEVPADENPKDKGYLVKYPDGYVSWCPKAQFEKQGFQLEDGTRITEGDVERFCAMGRHGVKTIESISGKPVTVLERDYPTGFTAIDTSTCVDAKNYSPAIGAETCAKRLNVTLWQNLGFMLQWAINGLTKKGGK
ncbi:MAG: hypothetical protein J6Z49_08050 [Kiritimatiellae bacterium]|nr:hypothetical protein [Kiritimatiellia bacterium]